MIRLFENPLSKWDESCYTCQCGILRQDPDSKFTSALIMICDTAKEAETVFEKWKNGDLTNDENMVQFGHRKEVTYDNSSR